MRKYLLLTFFIGTILQAQPAKQKPDQQLFFAAQKSDIAAVKAALAAGANVNYQDPATGLTPLMYAALGDVEILELLLKKGALVNLQGKPPSEGTALDNAIANRNKATQKILEAAGGKRAFQLDRDKFQKKLEENKRKNH